MGAKWNWPSGIGSLAVDAPFSGGHHLGGERRIVLGNGETTMGLFYGEGLCLGVIIRDGRMPLEIGSRVEDASPLDERDTLLFFDGVDGARVLQDTVNHAILQITGKATQGPLIPLRPVPENGMSTPEQSAPEAK